MRLLATATLVATLSAAVAPLAAVETAPRTSSQVDAGNSEVNGELYDINDLRLTGGFMPKHNQVDSTSSNWSKDYRLSFMWVRSPSPLQDIGGLIYGVEGTFDSAGKSTPSGDVSVLRFMGNALVGWAYRLPNHPSLHFEATPMLGLGFERYHSAVGGSPTTLGYEYAFRVAAYYTWMNMWQAGLDLRYLSNHSEPDFGGGVGSKKFNTQGGAVLFSVGKRY
jgi:hypothetical protein